MGGRFLNFLRGYAGIGVIFSHLQLLLGYLNKIGGIGVVIEAVRDIGVTIDVVATIMFFFGLPVFVLIAAIPPLIVLDIMKEHRIRFIRNYAKQMGLTKFVEASFEEAKRE